MSDFNQAQLTSKKIQRNLKTEGDEDLRSIKSEYDYGSKKKFLDVMGNISIDAKLKRMRAQHEMEKSSGRARAYDGVRGGDVSYKTYSKTTGKSRYSKRSSTCTHKRNLVVMN